MKMKKFIILMLICIGMMCSTVHAQHVAYISREVPTHNSSFKTYMDAKALHKSSPQYKFIQEYGYIDENGFYRCAAEPDFGVTDDYYLVAMGSYYTRTVGDKFRVTTDTGRVFYVAVADFKADAHTDSKHQYTRRNGDVIECIVNTKTLLPEVRRMGTCNVFMPLNGSIAKVEKMNFILE